MASRAPERTTTAGAEARHHPLARHRPGSSRRCHALGSRATDGVIAADSGPEGRTLDSAESGAPPEHDPLTSAAMPPQLPATEINALLGQGTRFEGKLHFEGRVRIDGYFRGQISSHDVLVIGEGAEVEGEIDVASIIIKGGVVRANVRATQSIELYVPAIVNGTLHAPEIFIDKGVQFSGTCTMAPVEGAPVE